MNRLCSKASGASLPLKTKGVAQGRNKTADSIKAKGVTGIIDEAFDLRANVKAMPKLAAQATANRSPHKDVAWSCEEPKAINAIPINAKTIVHVIRLEIRSPSISQLASAAKTGMVATIKTVFETAVSVTDNAKNGPLMPKKKPYQIAFLPIERNWSQTLDR